MRNRYRFIGSVGFAAMLGPATVSAQEAPQIFAGSNGEIEATYSNNCVVYYDANGRQTKSNANCTDEQVRRAETGVRAYRSEQGMDGYEGSEAPPDGFGGPNSTSAELHLVCFGDGHKPQTRTIPRLSWDRREHEFDTSYRTILLDSEFNSMVQIEVVGDSGYIWLPKDLQPPINSGGDHGWWEIREMELTSDGLSGRYRLNGLNRPHVNLDLRINRLVIKGQRSFEGYCEPS